MILPDEYGLLRAFFINSLSPGCINEIRVAGSACLTGPNGNGKTSYLRCVPLFYGELPSRIVPNSPNLKRFGEYYLPHPNSYIVFEYQRPGRELRCVVIYTDESGDRLHYRFIRQGFDVALLIADGSRIVSGRELERHLVASGVQCSRQLESTADYRRVIQADLSAARASVNTPSLRQLIAEYSCASAATPLTGIETIVQSMFKRQADFEDLRALVIQSVSQRAEAGAEFRLNVPHTTLETWPIRTRAYRRAMGAEKDVLAAAQVHEEVSTQNALLAALRGRAMRLQRDYMFKAEGYEQTATHYAAQRAEEESAVVARDKALTARLVELSTLAGNLEGQLKGIQERGARLERDEAPALAIRAERESALQGELASLTKEHTALTQDSQAIEAAYQALQAAPRERLAKGQIDHERELRWVSEAQSEENRQIADSHRDRLNAIDAEFNPQAEKLRSAVNQATVALALARANAQRPMADDSLVAAQADKLAAVVSGGDALGAAIDQAQDAERAYGRAQREFVAAEEELRRANRAADQAQDEFAKAERAADPPPNSLHRFLIDYVPDWGRNIGKVIAPPLLARTDLRPGLAEGGAQSESFFGVRLRLEGLPESTAADAEARSRELEAARAGLAQALKRADDTRSALERAGAARKAADANLSKARAEEAVAKRVRDAAKTEYEQATHLVKESLEAARLDAQRLLHDAEQREAELEQELGGAIAARAQAIDDAAALQKKHLGAAAERADGLRQNAMNRWREMEQAVAAELSKLEIRRDAALRAKGVDTESLRTIEGRKTQVAGELRAIELSRRIVADWKAWQTDEAPKIPVLEGRIQDAAARAGALKLEMTRLNEQWEVRERELKSIEVGGRKAAAAASKLAGQCAQLVANIKTPLPSLEPDAVDPVWTPDYLNTQAMNAIRVRERAEKDVDEHLKQVFAAFNSDPGSPPNQYVQQIPGEGKGEILQHLLGWFVDGESAEAVHKHHRSLLITEAEQIGELIDLFHASLDAFHKNIQTFNRQLQASLDSNCQFRAINKLTFKVESTVRTLDFWPVITRLVEAFRAWRDEGRTGLPGDEFTESLGRLLEHVELKTGLEADRSKLIRLEGTVEDKGVVRKFANGQHLQDISSHGLSYLVLISLFLAFIHRLRGSSKVNLAWSLDELLALDAQNVQRLLKLLEDNRVTLVCAFPDPNPETLSLFGNRYLIHEDKRPGEALLMTSALESEIDALVATEEDALDV